MRIRSSKALLAALVATALTAPFGGHAVSAATFKLTTLDREGEITSQPLIWWMKTIAEKTDKRVEFQPYWSQSLVAAPRTLSAVKNGIADAGFFASNLVSNEARDLSPLDIDNALPTDERYVDTWKKIEPAMTRILDQQGIVMLWPRRSPKVTLACHDKFLTQASDYKGVKIRAGGRWESATITRWGGSPFSIPPADTYTALQSGTVDCTYHIYPLVWALKFFEPAPFITQIEDSAAMTFMAMNRSRWNQISEADRNTIKAVSDEAIHREITMLAQRELGIIEDIKKLGGKFFKPSDAEHKRLRDAIQPLWNEVRGAVGPNGVELANVLEQQQKSR